MNKKKYETLFYSAAGVAAMALILVAFNVITGAFRVRLDLTKEKAYTLSQGTREILAKLTTPVKIRFYCTQDVTPTAETIYLKNYAKEVQDLLDEYKQDSNGKLVVEKYDPEPDSDAEDSAQLDGIEAQTLPDGDKFYLGLAVSQLDQKQAIPFLSPTRERLLEYDLTRAISRVISPEKATIGVMTPLPVFGMPSNPMMGMSQPNQSPWEFISELKSDYNVQRVPMDTDKIDDDIKVLIVIHPRGISDRAQYAIDQFIMRGGKLIAFLDPLSLVDASQQRSMMGGPSGEGSSLPDLLKAWGLQFNTDKVVADMNFKMRMGGGNNPASDAPAVLSVTGSGINNKDIIAGEIDDLWLPFAGAFTGTPTNGLKETVLLRSTKDSQLVEGMMARMAGQQIENDFQPSGQEYPLAIRLTGRFKTAFPDGEPAESTGKTNEPPAQTNSAPSLKATQGENAVLLVGDSDMLYDNFTIQRMQSPFGTLTAQLNGNLNFVENAVDQMAGDNDLIAVRSRATLNHPFTVVKKMQAEAQLKFENKIKELQQDLSDTENRLQALQQTKEKGERYILSPEQQAELEKFRTKEAETKKQLKLVKRDLTREIDALEIRTEWINIAAMPLLVSISGIVLAVVKRKRTGAK